MKGKSRDILKKRTDLLPQKPKIKCRKKLIAICLCMSLAIVSLYPNTLYGAAVHNDDGASQKTALVSVVSEEKADSLEKTAEKVKTANSVDTSEDRKETGQTETSENSREGSLLAASEADKEAGKTAASKDRKENSQVAISEAGKDAGQTATSEDRKEDCQNATGEAGKDAGQSATSEDRKATERTGSIEDPKVKSQTDPNPAESTESKSAISAGQTESNKGSKEASEAASSNGSKDADQSQVNTDSKDRDELVTRKDNLLLQDNMSDIIQEEFYENPFLSASMLWNFPNLLISPYALSEETTGQISLEAYLNTHGGSIESSLERDGELLEPDQNGEYPDIYGDSFEYSLHISAPKGIAAGDYYYQLPRGIYIAEEDCERQIIKDTSGFEMGTRTIDSNQIMHIHFYESMNDKMNVNGYIYCEASIEQPADAEDPIEADIQKKGYFDPNDGLFHFTIQADIPAYDGVEYKNWVVYDQYEYTNNFNFKDQNLDDIEIKISVDNHENELHELYDAISMNETMAYCIVNNKLILVNRCHCSINNCPSIKADEDCSISTDSNLPDGWCSCWTLCKNAIISITYVYEDSFLLLNQYPGKSFHNRVTLDSDSLIKGITSDTHIPIPSLIQKTTQTNPSTSNHHTTTYQITINKDKYDLSSHDSITIEDIMTHLAYVQGSLKVLAEDPSGQKTLLELDQDYKLIYLPELSEPKLEVQILHPGEVSYTITYQALVAGTSEGNKETVDIKNAATLKLFGEPSASVSSRYTFRAGWSYRSLQLTLVKKDLWDEHLLEGAVFGLYSADGQMAIKATTDEHGEIIYRCDIPHNQIITTDTPYYIKEEKAPIGYECDEETYWFYISDRQDTTLEEDYPTIHRIALESTNQTAVQLIRTNKPLPKLPEAGGCGLGFWNNIKDMEQHLQRWIAHMA